MYLENEVIMQKVLILIHNYFKKGPIEVITFNKENQPIKILQTIIKKYNAASITNYYA